MLLLFIIRGLHPLLYPNSLSGLKGADMLIILPKEQKGYGINGSTGWG